MLKNLFASGKCLLGFHQGEWRYEAPGSCLQFQVCEHCKKRSTKTEHTWNKWTYKQDGQCQQVRVCLRCQENETQMVHVWSADAYYKTEGECTAVNYCERCKEQKLYGTVHEWKDWVYSSDDNCNQIQKCGRCGTLGGDKRVNHMWSDWQYSSFYKARVRVCHHCGSMPLQFDATSTSQFTIQAVDVLFQDFTAVKSVMEIARLMRAHPFVFDQPVHPIVPAYLHLIDVHMPEGSRKQFYKSLGEECKTWGVIGSEAILSELDAIMLQRGEPWSLASSAVLTAARKKFQPKSDQRLIGHWIFTNVMGGGGFSSVTDYHKIFQEDGSFQEYSRSVSASLGTDRRTSPTLGTWSSQNSIITIRFADGTSSEIPYQLEGNTLVLSNHRGIWQRA